MKVKQIGLIFLLLWLFTFVASFIAPRWVEPTGDGFTRGLNRIGHWMGWQFAATLLAITCCIIALRYFRPNKRWKLTFLIPIFGQISLVLLIAGVIVYTRFRDAPPPVETAPPKPTAATMDLPASPDSPQTTIESYAGFYRKGFEQSHFYSSTGGLPYWLIADGSVADKIEAFVVERTGRGSGVTVALDLNAWIDPDTEDLDHMENFRGKLHVVSINTIRQISGEEFELVVSKIGPKE